MGRAGAGAVQGGRAEWPSRGVRACASARRACARARAERACDRHAARDAALECLCVALESLTSVFDSPGGVYLPDSFLEGGEMAPGAAGPV